MKLTIEAEHACKIIDFLKRLTLEEDCPTSDDTTCFISPSIIDKIAEEIESEQPEPVFKPFNKEDCLVIIQKNEYLDVIWNDGSIGYSQGVRSINFDNVVAYREVRIKQA